MVAIYDTTRRMAARLPGHRRVFAALSGWMPKGLYARALIIIIAPIVLLESVVAFSFMERHWNAVTRRLSEKTAGEIAAIIDFYQNYSADDDYRSLIDMAHNRLSLSVQILPAGNLPAQRRKPFFDLLDRTLTGELAERIKQPFWIDTIGRSKHVEIRVKMDHAVLRVVARRSQTYASNSHIFLVWMVGSSLVLLTVAILFLRNQIRPILRLADAADSFGKGRPTPEDFRPRGAREVRQAAFAFMEMRDRIEKHVEQRTTMLAGVSHDLRTILTRFRLQLAMLGETVEADALRSDVQEMQAMLADYMAFAKGAEGQEAAPTDVRDLFEEIRDEAAHLECPIEVIFKCRRKLVVPLRRHAIKRAINNLVTNAARYAGQIRIAVSQDRRWLRIEVEDDGPGIPASKREEVFRPFYRLDAARNQDIVNTGLGLSIARDITRAHGGDIWLEDSTLGGLKAVVRLPI